MKRYAIFDLDGTLLDSMGVWQTLDVKFLKKFGIVPTDEVRKKVRSLSIFQTAELYKDIYNIQISIEEILQMFNEMVKTKYDEVVLKPYVVEFLEKLRIEDVKMCIATAGIKRNAERVLKRLGINKYFNFVISGDDVQKGKEEDKIYLECIKRLNADVRDVMVFEDVLHAVKTAKQAGFWVCGVRDEFSLKDEQEIKAISDVYINSFEELL